jgi:hypothetical protein
VTGILEIQLKSRRHITTVACKCLTGWLTLTFLYPKMICNLLVVNMQVNFWHAAYEQPETDVC